MGGLASIRLIRSSALPENKLEALMRAVIFTSAELPVRTFTLPDPVLRSTFTGPVTCKVRWNDPSAEAAAGEECRQIITTRLKAASMERVRPDLIISSREFCLVNVNIPRTRVHRQPRPAVTNFSVHRSPRFPHRALDNHRNRSICHHLARSGGRV